MTNYIQQRIRLVKELTIAHQSGATLDEILDTITQGMVDKFNSAFARIWLIEQQGGKEYLILKASSGMYTNLQGSRSRLPLPDTSKLGQIVSSRRGHFTNDVYHDSGVLDHNWARENKLVALAGYPLINYRGDNNAPFGVLILYRRKPINNEEYEALDMAVAQIINIVTPHLGLTAATTPITINELSSGKSPSFWARLFGRSGSSSSQR